MTDNLRDQLQKSLAMPLTDTDGLLRDTIRNASRDLTRLSMTTIRTSRGRSEIIVRVENIGATLIQAAQACRLEHALKSDPSTESDNG